MAAVILPPQDCLGNGLRRRGLVLSPPLKSRRNPKPRSSGNPNFNRDDAICCSGRRRRVPMDGGRSGVRETSTTAAVSPRNLVMGQVKILKRGEALESKGEDLDLVLGSTHRLGPDPDLMQKQVSEGIYAGSGAFFASPPPSLVPFPSFLDKNGVATNDLRRLLRLDLD